MQPHFEDPYLAVSRPLPLRPTPNLRETIPSFLARMSATNGVCAPDFALDMGFSLKRTINLEKGALQALARCGGLSDTQLLELCSWTGHSIGDVQIRFRGENFVSRALRNPIIRGCPNCLREDIEASGKSPLTRMYLRGHWALREVRICLSHHRLLVPLWECARPLKRFDLQSRFGEIVDDIVQSRFDHLQVEPSSFERWLDGRLANGGDETWLAKQSLYASSTFCRLLGAQMLGFKNISDLKDEEAYRSAQAEGFNAAKDGEEAIREVLFSLSARADKNQDEPQKAFGQLYTDLGRAHLLKDEFEPFRKILRDCIIDVWPVAKGETILGYVQPERRLHSVLTAAKEADVGPQLMRELLIDGGALSDSADPPNSRKTFSATLYANFLGEIPKLVGPAEMCAAMNITRSQFRSLANGGILKPFIGNPKVKAPWRLRDGVQLVEELEELSVAIGSVTDRWEGISQAKNRTRLGVETIIAAVRDRSIRLGKCQDLEGYVAFRVSKSEIDELRESMSGSIRTDLITAAAFGRSVGMRGQGWFESLAAAGYASATRNLSQSGDKLYVSPKDVESFHEQFFTPATMERRFGKYRRTLLKKLEVENVKPFSPKGKNFGRLYLRKEVERVLSEA